MRRYIFFILLGLLFFPFRQLQAAELSIINNYQAINIGQEFEVVVYLNTENEKINALSGKIIFPEQYLELVRIKNNDSVINFWIEMPSLSQPGEVSFSGIIPGGLEDNRSKIFSLIFRAKSAGSEQVSISDFSALLNDGQGTAVNTKTVSALFNISDEVIVYQPGIEEVADFDLPESFNPLLTQIPEIADNKYLLVFLTQDKGSGISHYEVKEGWGSFKVATSPYVLENQKLNQKIFVKAIDQAGNARVVTFIPPNYLPWYKNYQLFGIIILVIIFAYFSQRYSHKNKKTTKT